jgi:hypothetical protein
MREIERQASEAWRTAPCEVPPSGTNSTVTVAVAMAQAEAMAVTEERNAIAAYDFLTVQVLCQPDDQGSGGNQVAGTRRQLGPRNNNNAAKRRKKTRAQGPSS